jgi:hypothetical protein
LELPLVVSNGADGVEEHFMCPHAGSSIVCAT